MLHNPKMMSYGTLFFFPPFVLHGCCIIEERERKKMGLDNVLQGGAHREI